MPFGFLGDGDTVRGLGELITLFPSLPLGPVWPDQTVTVCGSVIRPASHLGNERGKPSWAESPVAWVSCAPLGLSFSTCAGGEGVEALLAQHALVRMTPASVDVHRLSREQICNDCVF